MNQLHNITHIYICILCVYICLCMCLFIYIHIYTNYKMAICCWLRYQEISFEVTQPPGGRLLGPLGALFGCGSHVLFHVAIHDISATCMEGGRMSKMGKNKCVLYLPYIHFHIFNIWWIWFYPSWNDVEGRYNYSMSIYVYMICITNKSRWDQRKMMDQCQGDLRRKSLTFCKTVDRPEANLPKLPWLW